MDAGDTSGTDNANNNFDNKNAYVKASFNIYNNLSANAGTSASADVVAGDTTGTENAGSTGRTSNTSNSKNTYTKACFNTYNIAGTNADTNDISNIRDVIVLMLQTTMLTVKMFM